MYDWNTAAKDVESKTIHPPHTTTVGCIFGNVRVSFSYGVADFVQMSRLAFTDLLC